MTRRYALLIALSVGLVCLFGSEPVRRAGKPSTSLTSQNASKPRPAARPFSLAQHDVGVGLALPCSGSSPCARTGMTEPAWHTRPVQAYGKLPLSFEANRGQTDPRVKFLTRGRGYSLFLTGNEAVLALRKDSGFRSQKSVAPAGTRPDDIGRPARLGSADLAFGSAAFPRSLRSPAAVHQGSADLAFGSAAFLRSLRSPAAVHQGSADLFSKSAP